MAVKGITRYRKLAKNIANWKEYVFRRGERKNRPLEFVTKPNPIRFKVPDSLYQVFKEIFMEDFYEIDSLVKKLSPQAVVVDVGANAGFFDFLLLSKLPSAAIYAYEPLSSNIQLLTATRDSNSTLLQKLHVTQAAITGTATASLDLFTENTPDNSVVASVFSGFDERNTTRITVPAKSLTAIVQENNITQIDLLKLDCEGSEYDILYNTPGSVLNTIKMMVIEVHEIDRGKHNLQSLTAYLNSCGYRTRSQPITPESYYLQAIKA